jgi:hypothetical protein
MAGDFQQARPLPPTSSCIGSRDNLASGERYRELRSRFPKAHVVGCSTGGQIRGGDITDEEIAVVAMSFAATPTRIACEPIADTGQSRSCGEAIGRALSAPGLAGLFVLSDGLHVNGSALVAGIGRVVGRHIPITGGLAGDGSRFETTLVGADVESHDHSVAAIGFYGTAIRFGYGSGGGWDVFGPRRRITRSSGNVLYELDGAPALDLYERYLGDEEARNLPGSALLFPLQIHRPSHTDHSVVRTILAINRDERSMTFAGDMPEGWVAQLMRGDIDRLTDGAMEAARQAGSTMPETSTEGIALLISCIGRRLLLGQRIAEEIEAAGAALGPAFRPLGFYSYGEISPNQTSGMCELHNQTMTVTTITEVAA